jgi:hypothetical protein
MEDKEQTPGLQSLPLTVILIYKHEEQKSEWMMESKSEEHLSVRLVLSVNHTKNVVINTRAVL